MKKGNFFGFNLLLFSVLFVSSTLAQDSPQWHLPKGAKVRLGKGRISPIAYSPYGNFLAVGTSIGVWIYDVHTGAELDLLTGHTSEVESLAFSPDGTTLASGGKWGDNTIRLWDVDTGQLKATLTGAPNSVRSLAFSPDGKTLAYASGYGHWVTDGIVQLWDVATRQLTATLRGDGIPVNSVAFSPDGKILASASRHGNWGTDVIVVQLWDVATRQLTATLRGDGIPVNSVAFSPDGKILATGSGAWRTAGIVQLWDIDARQLTATFTGHTDSVSSVAFSPDGYTLASGSEDGTVLLWNVAPPTDKPPQVSVYDVNQDGIVNLVDLATIGAMFGQEGPRLSGDINSDGVVNILDLVAVSAHLDDTTTSAAPIARRGHRPFFPTPTGVPITPQTVQQWIAMAHTVDDGSLTFRRGIANLNALLAMLTPAETALLPNYPNPFNPETWIPYRLAEAADVTLTIYDSKGTSVRRFDLGHQLAGYYTNRTKAAYWDGRNEGGESVASGVYFYQLRAGDYTALRRMVILK